MERTQGTIKHERKVTGMEYLDYLTPDDGGFDLAEMESRPSSQEKHNADFDHIAATWNASAGMPTKQAVLFLEHGTEMQIMLKQCFDVMRLMPCDTLSSSVTVMQLKKLMAEMEGK